MTDLMLTETKRDLLFLREGNGYHTNFSSKELGCLLRVSDCLYFMITLIFTHSMILECNFLLPFFFGQLFVFL